jgi:ribonuclease Z
MKIIASSAALISSWFFLEDIGVCFDAGDGLCSGLGLKSRKIKHLFVSHADRDHLAGLLQFNALNGAASPVIYYPSDCGSFPALRDFCAAFDHHAGQSSWRAIGEGDEIAVGANLYVRALRSDHVQIPGKQKSLSFVLFKRLKKLRQEFLGRDVALLKSSVPEETLFEQREQRVFGYSGDGSPQKDLWTDVEVIAHESTFLRVNDVEDARARHAGFHETISMLADLRPKAAVLYHFSPRYSAGEIEGALGIVREQLGIDFPVHLVLPGAITRLLI